MRKAHTSVNWLSPAMVGAKRVDSIAEGHTIAAAYTAQKLKEEHVERGRESREGEKGGQARG